MEQEQNIKAIAAALRLIFGENQNSGKFIDISRIPLICQNINDIHVNLSELKTMVEKFGEKADKRYVNKDQFSPVRSIVFGAVALILVSFFGAIVNYFIHK